MSGSRTFSPEAGMRAAKRVSEFVERTGLNERIHEETLHFLEATSAFGKHESSQVHGHRVLRLRAFEQEVEISYQAAAGPASEPPSIICLPPGPNNEEILLRLKRVAPLEHAPASIRFSPIDKDVEFDIRIWSGEAQSYSADNVSAIRPAFVPEGTYETADWIEIVRVRKI
jgi:hypothetical protein